MQFGLADLKRSFFIQHSMPNVLIKTSVFILDSKDEIPHQSNANVIKLAS